MRFLALVAVGEPETIARMTRAATQQQIAAVMRAINAGQHESAMHASRDLVASFPDDPNPLALLSMTLARSGELDDAISAASKAADLGGDDRHDLRLGLAQLLRSAGRTDEAVAAFREIADRTNDPESWYGLALCHEQSRQYAEAASAARRVLAARPGHVMAGITLARALRAERKAEEALSQLNSYNIARAPAIVAVHLHTERGQCLDQLGRYDEAFAAFTKANAAFDSMPESMRISKDAFPAILDATRHLLQSDRWKGRAVFDPASETQPVFVVGFPRSGTTMFEQMLGSHSRVVTSDEAPFIRDVVRDIESMGAAGGTQERGGYPGALVSLTAEQCAELRGCYWAHARKRLGPTIDSRVLVDKQPLNIAFLACIGRIFPGAKVIVVVRDPMDTVLSCFMQAFTPNQATVHFSSLKRTADLYARVMSLWLETRDSTGVDALMVRYEDVIDNPRKEVTRCLQHIGLSWEDGIESFYERIGRRFISTPSSQGVATPISRKSVGRWDRYHDRVNGVLQIVERFRIEFGYARSE